MPTVLPAIDEDSSLDGLIRLAEELQAPVMA